MSDTTTKAPDASRFASIFALRARGKELLKAERDPQPSHAFLDAVMAFVSAAQATGAVLDADDERWAAQSLIDYWANFLTRRGVLVLEPMLAPFDATLAPELPDSACPYVGLKAFGEPEHPYFFGRQALVEELAATLFEHRWLAVVGSSGSGKSSVVLAGLLPALRHGSVPIKPGVDWRFLAPIIPGSDPIDALARLLCGDRASDADVAREREALLTNDRRLLRALEEQDARSAFLIVDQFEEVFTLCTTDRLRDAFVSSLVQLVRAPGKWHTVVVTMRSDFESYLERLPVGRDLFTGNTVRVVAMGAAELRAAIESPAALVGLKLEEGIADRLVQETLGEPAGLPLLQFTLLKLWEKRRHNLVTWQIFNEVGGCHKALTRTADELYESLIPQTQDTLRRVLLQLVQPTTGLEVVNNRIREVDLYRFVKKPTEQVDQVLNLLVTAGLVRRTPGLTREDSQIEVAHEALVRNWPTLVSWIDDERVRSRQRLALRGAARQWDAFGRVSSALLRGPQLQEARKYDDLDTLEQKFVARSVARQRRLRVTTIAAFVSVLVALIAGTVFSLRQRNEARRQRDLAQAAERRSFSRQLAALSRSRFEDRLDLALLLSVEAFEVEQTPEARVALLGALEYSPQLQAFLHAVPSRALAFSSDQAAVRSINADGTVGLLPLDGKTVDPPRAGQEETGLAAVTNDGRRGALVKSGGSAVQIRNLEQQADEPITFAAGSPVTTMALSPTGRYVASVNADRELRLWNVTTRRLVRTLRIDAADSRLAFSADDRRLAVGTTSHIVIHDLRDASSQVTFGLADGDVESGVTALAFSPNGTMLAIGHADNAVTLWNTLTGELQVRLIEHRGIVRSLAFTPRGNILASGGEDNAIVIWDVVSSVEQRRPVRGARLTGHSSAVTSLAFAADGLRLASAGADNKALTWDIGRTRRLAEPLPAPPLPAEAKTTSRRFLPLLSALTGGASARRGQLLAGSRQDGAVFFWDVPTRRLLDTLTYPPPVRRETGSRTTFSRATASTLIALSADGSVLAAWEPDRVVLWDVAQRTARATLAVPPNLASLALSPDGSLLVVSDRRAVYLWERDGQRLELDLGGAGFPVTALAFGPSGRVLAAGGETAILIMDFDQPRARKRFVLQPPTQPADAPARTIRSLEFGAGGLLAVGYSDNTVALWDVAAEKLVRQPSSQQTRPVTSLSFAPDDATFASASADGTIALWEVQGRQPLGRLPATAVGPRLSGSALNIAFVNQQALASVGSDSRPYVWDVDPLSWVRRACALANRDMTEEEWVQSIGESKEYRSTCRSLRDAPGHVAGAR